MENPWKSLSKINPQREAGHRQIGNDIFSALVRANFTVAEYKVVLSIIGRTWGFNRVSAPVSISKLAEDTGLPARSIKRTIVQLRARRVIVYQPSNVKKNGSFLNDFLFNKHFDTWLDRNIPALPDSKTGDAHDTGTGDAGDTGQVTPVTLVRVTPVTPNKEKHLIETLKEKTHTPVVCVSEAEDHFKTFWTAYPARDGHKTGKEKTMALFYQFSPEDQVALTTAAKNYADSEQIRRGVGILDPANFIRRQERKTGEVTEPWRDWITSAPGDSDTSSYMPDLSWKADLDRAEAERKEFERKVAAGEIQVRPRDHLPFTETEAEYEAKKAAGTLRMVPVKAAPSVSGWTGA